VARELMDRGWKDVHALHGGFEAWQKEGLPTEPVPRGAGEVM
jgi:3-mercaptopyruvate sulfurtransferase SseA